MSDYIEGWKIVHPDGTTGRNTAHHFQWPLPTNGQPVIVKAPGPLLDHRDSCPKAPGDGLCAALPYAISVVTHGDVRLARCVGLLLDWLPEWVIGDCEPGKVRLSQVRVRSVFDPLHLIRLGLASADLWGADLLGADLRGADLLGADLRGADLRGADLRDADLRDANLRDADLWGANLRGANTNKSAKWPNEFDPNRAGVRVYA